MKRHFHIYILLALLSPFSTAGENIDLEQVYRELDEAILQTDKFVQERENRIQQFKSALEATSDARVQYEMCRRLYDEYHPYMSDSAIHYIGRCIMLADKLDDRIRSDEGKLLLAYQCTESGMYHEAMDILDDFDEKDINDATNRQRYYSTLAHLYQELGYYCKVPHLQEKYYASSDRYKQLIDTVACSSDEALQIKEMACFNAGDAPGALRYSDMRLAQVKEGSHEYAIVAFYRYLDYSLLGDSVQARYWVT